MYVNDQPNTLMVTLKSKIDLGFQFMRFCAVGAIFALTNVGLLWLLVNTLKVHYLAAVFVAFILLNWISYWLNKVVTFRLNSEFVAEELSRYYSVLAFNLVINLTGMWIAVDICGVHFLTASIGLMTALAFLNFAAHKVWTFRQSASRK